MKDSMEFTRKRSGMLNFIFIAILKFTYKILVTTLETDPYIWRNRLKFGYRINYKYEEQLSHSIDRHYVVVKF